MITTINEWKRDQNTFSSKHTEFGEEFLTIQLNLNNLLTKEQIIQLKQVIQPEPGVNIRFINANSTITVNGTDYNKLRTIMDSIKNELKIILNSNFNEAIDLTKNYQKNNITGQYIIDEIIYVYQAITDNYDNEDAFKNDILSVLTDQDCMDYAKNIAPYLNNEDRLQDASTDWVTEFFKKKLPKYYEDINN